jgi:hypothetical protein
MTQPFANANWQSSELGGVGTGGILPEAASEENVFDLESAGT